ncbi:MAG TPA: hypothetical protein VII93_14340 [Anaerolineales bacterium]
MTDKERNQVLKMIESGTITPEEGLHLMEALDQSPAEEEGIAEPMETGPESRTESETGTDLSKTRAEESSFETDPRISRVKSAARRLWQIPLWIGIVITVVSATGMYAIMHGPGMNFWFYFLALPLLLGVAIVAAAVGSRKARWIFVNVQQKPGEKPAHIFLGFPLPLKLAAWFLRNFGHRIPDLKKTNVEDVIEVMETGFTGNSPLIVHVDEGDDGERVQVYIG